jgi:hypothetical protein
MDDFNGAFPKFKMLFLAVIQATVQQTRLVSIPSRAPSFAILSATWPLLIAQWCAGPALDHSLRNL